MVVLCLFGASTEEVENPPLASTLRSSTRQSAAEAESLELGVSPKLRPAEEQRGTTHGKIIAKRNLPSRLIPF